jgi:hypothetical protein
MGGIAERARRHAWWIALGVVVVAIVALPVSIHTVNDVVAGEVEGRLIDLPLPQGAELVDSMSQAGRIVGNGNGMQYVGALLLRSSDSLSELQRFYDEQRQSADLAITVTPSDALENDGFHGAHGFLGSSGERGTYVVYGWGSAPGEIFENFDLRGH